MQLRIEMLPARQGDAILVSWGPADQPAHFLLVDGGPAIAYQPVARRLAELASAGAHLELAVLSHLDRDHIEGMILLANDAAVALPIREVWYNGYRHLAPDLGGVQGEILGAIIKGRGLRWNGAFGGHAVCRPEAGALPTRDLPDGLRLTVLAPDPRALLRLRDAWETECAAAGLDVDSVDAALARLRERRDLSTAETYLGAGAPLDVRQLAEDRRGADRSVANASCIVLLIEYAGQAVLLTGDATPQALADGVRRLLAERGRDRLPLAALKLPHHGSMNNIDAALVRLLPARHYLISTDGSYYQHPHDAAVATVVRHAPPGAELVFNYPSASALRWADADLQRDHGYRLARPARGDGGIAVTLRP